MKLLLAALLSTTAFSLQTTVALAAPLLDVTPASETSILAEKESFRNESTSLVSTKCVSPVCCFEKVVTCCPFCLAVTNLSSQLSHHLQLAATPFDDDRALSKCRSNEQFFKLDLTTDNYGFETRWVLKTASDTPIMRGPPSGTNYASNTRYLEGICLPVGESYKFVIIDSFKDGICCDWGSGSYAGYVNGVKKMSSPRNAIAWGKRVHRFTIVSPPPTSNPITPLPTTKPTIKAFTSKAPTVSPSKRLSSSTELKKSSCSSSERRVKVELLTDKHGEDTSWEVINAQGKTLVESNKVYAAYEFDVSEFCLAKGSSYEFVLHDVWGDGMCCTSGQGHFKVYIEDGNSWKEIIAGGAFKKKELRLGINLKQHEMTERDHEWLDSHNTRRKEWHTAHGKSYVPLQWSEALKEDAQEWAEKLLDSCGKGMWHDPNNSDYGENVAGNSGSGSWGALRTTEQVLTRFVEYEADDNWPKNSHLTQVLWRSSKYVGCAEASKPYGNNNKGLCHSQVCRYARTGNCNMSQYKDDNSNDWWLEPMLLDESACGSQCPRDGCY